MPRPNIMWFWGLILVGIVGYWIFGEEQTQPVKSDWNKVEQLVIAGDVEKITVVNRDEARVAIKANKIDSLRETDLRYKELPKTGYQLFFNIGSVDSFKSDLEEAEAQGGNRVVVAYENEKEWYDSWLVGLLPWVIMIAV